jgi:hypothetical protein
MDAKEHESGLSIMPRQQSRNQARLVWVLVGIGLFLVACVILTLFMTFTKTAPVE